MFKAQLASFPNPTFKQHGSELTPFVRARQGNYKAGRTGMKIVMYGLEPRNLIDFCIFV